MRAERRDGAPVELLRLVPWKEAPYEGFPTRRSASIAFSRTFTQRAPLIVLKLLVVFTLQPDNAVIYLGVIVSALAVTRGPSWDSSLSPSFSPSCVTI